MKMIETTASAHSPDMMYLFETERCFTTVNKKFQVEGRSIWSFDGQYEYIIKCDIKIVYIVVNDAKLSQGFSINSS